MITSLSFCQVLESSLSSRMRARITDVTTTTTLPSATQSSMTMALQCARRGGITYLEPCGILPLRFDCSMSEHNIRYADAMEEMMRDCQ